MNKEVNTNTKASPIKIPEKHKHWDT